MQYLVRALSPAQSIVSVRVEGLDLDDVRRELGRRGLQALSIQPAAPGISFALSGLAPRPQFSVLLFSQELLALLEAGLSLVESIEALLEKEAVPARRTVLQRVLACLRDGLSFSVTLARLDTVFPALYVGMIQAAEGTSDLPRSLARYIDYRNRIDALRARVVSASIYPAILTVVGAAVSLFLMAYVVPRFAVIYKDTGRPLPTVSRWLLEWGSIADAHGTALLAGFATLALALVWGARRAWRGGHLIAVLGRVAGVGARIRIFELSRLYMTMGMLLEGGIPVRATLAMAGASVLPATRVALTRVGAQIAEGVSLSQAFDTQGLTTPIALRMLRVGERSGRIGAMLTRSAQFHEGETARWMERFTRMFEPLLMAVIGMVIGAIVVMLYMPIFDLAGSLQ